MQNRIKTSVGHVQALLIVGDVSVAAYGNDLAEISGSGLNDARGEILAPCEYLAHLAYCLSRIFIAVCSYPICFKA